jgi:hypothetical protein
MRGKDFTPHIWTGRSDLDALLHPAQAYDHPDDVANDPDLSLNEKRAILASWASDACAVEAAPALRCPAGGKRVVSFDEVTRSGGSIVRRRRSGPTPSGLDARGRAGKPTFAAGGQTIPVMTGTARRSNGSLTEGHCSD